jgi:hypothetical protein
MNAATPPVSRSRRCAKTGPSVKKALVATPHRKAATMPNGDCRYRPLMLIPGAPPHRPVPRGPSQSDRHQRERDNDRDYTERPEACRVGCRKKELSDDSGQQTRHGIDAQDLSPGVARRGAVEPALNDNEQSSKAEPGQGASHDPRYRIHQKQVQEAVRSRRSRREPEKLECGPRFGSAFHSVAIQSRHRPRSLRPQHQFERARSPRSHRERSAAWPAVCCPSA